MQKLHLVVTFPMMTLSVSPGCPGRFTEAWPYSSKAAGLNLSTWSFADSMPFPNLSQDLPATHQISLISAYPLRNSRSQCARPGITGNTPDHQQQKPRKPRNPSFPTAPVLVRQTSYPNVTTGPQRSQWLPRRNTIHHPIAYQPPLLKDYNSRSQPWRPIQGNHINRGVPETFHWY